MRCTKISLHFAHQSLPPPFQNPSYTLIYIYIYTHSTSLLQEAQTSEQCINALDVAQAAGESSIYQVWGVNDEFLTFFSKVIANFHVVHLCKYKVISRL